MQELAKHIVEQKSGHFEPETFEDHYEQALQELLNQKRKGLPIATARRPAPSNVFICCMRSRPRKPRWVLITSSF